MRETIILDYSCRSLLPDPDRLLFREAVAMTVRRFPPPCSVEEQPACFVVRDHNGHALAYVYSEDEPGRRSAAKLLTNDEARQIATHWRKRTAYWHKLASDRHPARPILY
jgi:hypothetical protein